MNRSHTATADATTPTAGPPDRRVAMARRLLYGIFFLSGVSGLGYQMVWTRMFSVGLGHEMPGVLAVVAAFFGGLALGGWLLDGPVSRSASPWRWYVGLELLIGVWGFVSIALIPLANDVAIRWMGVSPGPFAHWFIAFSIPLCALLPATTAMGATLPAMDRYVAGLTPDGRCIGGLYSANTLGAVGGTLGSAFIVVPFLGYRLTLVSMAMVNLFCAAATIAVARERVAEPPRCDTTVADALPRTRIYATVFFTGLLGIGYEVIGVRMMSQILENTVYSFAAALSIYLIGTAIGAAIYQRMSHRLSFGPALCMLLVGLSTSCLLGGIVLEFAPTVYRESRTWFGKTLGGALASELSVAAMIFALPTVLMGATFSHLVQAARHARGGVGRAAAINTLGGALAPAFFGVVTLPAVGAWWAWAVASLGYLALLPRSSGRVSLLPLIPLATFLFLPGQMQFLDVPEATRVVAYQQGVMSSVAVLEHENGDRGLTVNNHFRMGGTLARVPEQRQAMIPILLHPSPKRVLFLGIGTGMTLSGAFHEPEVECDAVELVPEIVAFLPLFGPANGAPTERDDVRIFAADARRFVRASSAQYDVVIADLFHPARDGAGALYTVEHFEAVRDRLADGGLFCQWLPLHQMDEEILRIAVRTYLQVFPHARAYLGAPTLDPPALGLVAAREPLHYPPDWIDRRITNPVLREGAASIGLSSIHELFGCLIADTRTLAQFAESGRLNTDNDPLIMFLSPGALFEVKGRKVALTLSLIDKWKADPTEQFSRAVNRLSVDDRLRFDQFVRARDVFLRGIAAAEDNTGAAALDAFLSSALLSSDFSAAFDRCLAAARQNIAARPAVAREILETLARAYPDRAAPREMLKMLEPSSRP